MAKAGTRSKSQESYYASYKSGNKWRVNRERRLQRALKEQPNNEQIKIALKGVVYRRKTPKVTEWSASNIAIAKLFKAFTGRVNRNIFSSAETVRTEAVRSSRLVSQYTPVIGNVDFTLGARAKFKATNGVY